MEARASPRSRMEAEAGVLVIGAGVIGLSVAMFLARDGCDVAIIDAGLPNGSATNAGSLHVQVQGRYIKRHPKLAAALERSLHLYPKAIAFWREIERDLGADFDLRATGGLMLAETGEQLRFLAEKTAREEKLGLDVALLGRNELRRAAPYLREDLIGAQLCPTEGKINPLLANSALRDEAARRGVRFLAPDRVLRIETAGAKLRAIAAKQVMIAGRIVLAAGPWSGDLARPLGVDLPADPRFLQMSITESAPLLVEHLVQHAELPMTLKQLDGGQVVIGGGWPALYREGSPTVAVPCGSIVGGAALAARLVPALARLRIIRTWAGATTTVDGQSVLGAPLSSPNVFFAIGGFAGYTLGPFIARLLADHMMGRRPAEDIAPFSPDRF